MDETVLIQKLKLSKTSFNFSNQKEIGSNVKHELRL